VAGKCIQNAGSRERQCNCIQSRVVIFLPEIPVSVLLVSADMPDRCSLAGIMARTNWSLRVRSTCHEALALLRETPMPVVICDEKVAGKHWISLLDALSDLPAPPFLIVCSRLADERLWAEVLNLGGYDVLPTPFDATEVL